MNLFICRHGEYTNPDNLIPYRLPRFGLSPIGIAQAEKIRDRLKNEKITHIIASPILRCRQTAAIINEVIKGTLSYSSLAIEAYSPFQGISELEYFAQGLNVFDHPRYLQQRGEPIERQYHRMHTLVQRLIKKFPQHNCLIVSHGDPTMSLIAGLIDHDLSAAHLNSMKYIPKGGLIEITIIGQSVKYKPLIY